jgi:hypothetical protein
MDNGILDEWRHAHSEVARAEDKAIAIAERLVGRRVLFQSGNMACPAPARVTSGPFMDIHYVTLINENTGKERKVYINNIMCVYGRDE